MAGFATDTDMNTTKNNFLHGYKTVFGRCVY